MKEERWQFKAGSRPHQVTAYERTAGGPLYARVWDPTLGKAGAYRKLSLGHRDQEAAKVYALEQAAKLARGVEDIRAGRVTLADVFAAYLRHRTPRKSPSEQKQDRRRAEMWSRVLGARKDPHRITLGEWESYCDLRRSGAIDPKGQPVPEGKRRPVRARTVEVDCDWLQWCFNWAADWRTPTGTYLMRENPVRGFEAPHEKNPRRPVMSQDRLKALLKVAGAVPMEIRWNGKRETRPSYLPELLVLANGTGRRISAIVGLKWRDVDLTTSKARPFGQIQWPGDTDKVGKEWSAPIGPEVRAALDRIRVDRPGIGDAPLFPSPKSPTEPISRHLADAWLRRAETLAKLETQDGSAWHALRRGWVTERKNFPLVDIAAAGGWGSVETLQQCYMQPDEATTLRVVLDEKQPVEVRR